MDLFMISYLTGTVKYIQEHTAVIEVGTIGVFVSIPENTAIRIDECVTLYTHFHWNQETGPALFGFKSELDRAVFLLIIGCSGVGPKLGLAILSQLGSAAFIEAIQVGDERALAKVSGIGAKKAEQIIVHLKHKVNKLLEVHTDLKQGARADQWHLITQVLESLHYSRSEVGTALRYLHEQYSSQQLPFDQLVRHALSFLAKKA
jgi:holliday junction DNA helicase RuvA